MQNQITLSAIDLQASLKHLLTVVPRRTNIPVLSMVHIKAADGLATLSVTDLDAALSVTIEAQGDCDMLLDARQLADKAGKAGRVTLAVVGDVGAMQRDDLSASVDTLPVADWPSDRNIIAAKQSDADTRVTMPAPYMANALRHVSFAMSDEETHNYLRGVYLHEQGGLMRLCATDGHMLGLYCSEDVKLDEGLGRIIPSETVVLLEKLLAKRKSDLHVTIGANLSIWTCENWTLVSKHVDGTFPDYSRVIPKEGGETVIALDKDFPVKVPRDDKKIAFSEGKATLAGSTFGWSHTGKETMFNAAYLNTIRKALGDCILRQDGAGDPARVVGKDARGLAVVMPMRR